MGDNREWAAEREEAFDIIEKRITENNDLYSIFQFRRNLSNKLQNIRTNPFEEQNLKKSLEYIDETIASMVSCDTHLVYDLQEKIDHGKRKPI